MKTTIYSSLFIFLLTLCACEKKTDEPVTRPVEFNETTYEPLGTYDDVGKPNYLLAKDPISSELISFINSSLPEKVDLRSTNPDLLNSSAIGDIVITQQSEVFITFVSQGTAYANTFVYYTYPTNQPPASPKDITKINYVFPNAGSGTPLQAGDKVKIGSFNAGTSIGFAILVDGCNPATKTINNKSVHFLSNYVLNPELDPKLKKHAVLISYPSENKVLIGFEDIDRTTSDCDHDFNDVVVYATVTP